MGKRVTKSAITGRFVRTSAAARHPKTTIRQTVPARAPRAADRSAITGRYISNAAQAGHPKTSVREG